MLVLSQCWPKTVLKWKGMWTQYIIRDRRMPVILATLEVPQKTVGRSPR